MGWQLSNDRLLFAALLVVVVVAAAAVAAVTTTIFTQEAPLTEVVFREVQELKVC